eukprot:6461397-Amphidinium_carterae.3
MRSLSRQEAFLFSMGVSFVRDSQGAATTSVGDGSSTRAPSEVGSASLSHSTHSPEDKREQAVNHWCVQLDITKLLSGASMGNALTYATRVLGGLRNGPQKDGVQTLLLASHIDLYKKAEKLLPTKISNISKAERMATARELRLASITLPPHVCGSFVSQSASELVEARETEELVDMLTPGQPLNVSFDPLKPLLRETGLGLELQAKIIQASVSDALLNKMASGESGKENVVGLSLSMVKRWKPLVMPEQRDILGELCYTALVDSLQVAEFFTILSREGTEHDAQIKCQQVMEATSGIKVVAKQATSRELAKAKCSPSQLHLCTQCQRVCFIKLTCLWKSGSKGRLPTAPSISLC